MDKKRFGLQMDDDTCDIKIQNGHLALGDTMAQNQYLILMSQKGEVKEHPTLGVGIADMLNDNDVLSWKRKVRVGLQADGMEVDKLDIDSDGHIKDLSAKYR